MNAHRTADRPAGEVAEPGPIPGLKHTEPDVRNDTGTDGFNPGQSFLTPNVNLYKL